MTSRLQKSTPSSGEFTRRQSKADEIDSIVNSPDGKKKAYVRLTADHDALDVANKVSVVRCHWHLPLLTFLAPSDWLHLDERLLAVFSCPSSSSCMLRSALPR